MGKLDELRRSAGRNVKDSTGAERGAGPVSAATPASAPESGPSASAVPPRWRGVERSRDAALIPVTMIDRDPDQPRQEFDDEELERLAESLRARGQLQPIRVRWDEGRGVYVVLVGERRWRAARLAGLERLACVVHDAAMDPEERLAVQLVENALRADLKPVEQARAYRRLMDARGYSTRDLAAELHVAQSSVVRALALLELPGEVQEKVEGGALAPTVAAELARIDDPRLVAEVAEAVVSEGLRRSEVSELVQAVRARRPAPARDRKPEPVTIDLGYCSVTIRWRKPSAVSALQALRRAAKRLQDQDRDDAERAA
jgi:ParB family chromosome partitioning protein